MLENFGRSAYSWFCCVSNFQMFTVCVFAEYSFIHGGAQGKKTGGNWSVTAGNRIYRPVPGEKNRPKTSKFEFDFFYCIMTFLGWFRPFLC